MFRPPMCSRDAHVLVRMLRFPENVMTLAGADGEPHVAVADVRARVLRWSACRISSPSLRYPPTCSGFWIVVEDAATVSLDYRSCFRVAFFSERYAALKRRAVFHMSEIYH